MAKKTTKDTIESAGGIDSVLNLVRSVDKSAEIIQDSAMSNIKEWIPSGNYILNACMSGDLFKAIPTGRIVSFCGPSGCLPYKEKVRIYRPRFFVTSIERYTEDDTTHVSNEQALSFADMIKELRGWYKSDWTSEYEDMLMENNDAVYEQFNAHCEKHSEVVMIGDLYHKVETSFLLSTPDGYQKVANVISKTPRKLYHIETASNSVICSEDHLIETSMSWQYARVLETGMSVLTANGWEEITNINELPEEEVYDFTVLHSNHRYWAGTGISSHNTGKSYLCCSICREAQKMGYTPIYMDSEGAIDAKFVSRLGVDPTRLIIKQVQTIFETSQFIANICKALEAQQEKTGTHDKIIFILDSLGNLTSEKERDDTLSGNQKADFTKAKDVKAMFRVNATPLAKLGVSLIVSNHVYSSMSFIPQNVQASGSGIVYNASVTVELSAAKLEMKENEAAAKQKAGADQTTKNGILVTAKPVKSRFCRPLKVKFQIPYFCKPNCYIGLESFMTWENSGVVRGSILTEKELSKMSDAEKAKLLTFNYQGTTMYAQPKDTARTIVVSHLGAAVPLTEFYTAKVFTPEYLTYLNDTVIKPMFELPDQSSNEDIKEIEEMLDMAEDTEPVDTVTDSNIIPNE